METLWQDIRYGLRMLAKNRGASVVAILTLALGIGATTSIFTIASELLFRPRPGIGAPQELVDIGRSQNGSGFDNMSYPNFVDLRDRNKSFSGVLAYMLEPRPISLNNGASSERIFGALVSGNYFSVLQATPAHGRFFTQEEDGKQMESPVTVLSYAFWQRRFSGDSGVVGRELNINGQRFTVVGIAQKDFRGTSVLAPDAWFPIATISAVIPGAQYLASRESVWMIAIGRLKPGVSIEQASAEATLIAAQLLREYPIANEGKGFTLSRSGLFPADLRTYVAGFMALLMVIVGLILVIVCVNVAGILLVRATARRREIAVRLALGAGKVRILRQLLTEGVLLFLLGGSLGLLLAMWMCDLLLGLIPQLPFPVAIQLHIDWRVLLFALGVSFIAGTLSALAPALHASRPDVVVALKDESQGGTLRRLRLRNSLVLGQMALSLLLLICGGLFVRALLHAKTLDPGFDAQNVQTIELDFALAGYKEADGLAKSDELLNRVRTMPGVVSAAYAWTLPLDGNGRSLGGILVAGHEPPDGGRMFDADWNIVTPGYFALMRIPLLRGRDFTGADRAGSQGVVIINETMAKRFWPGQDPVGLQIRTGSLARGGGERDDLHALTIIGVARDHKYRSLGDEARLFIYVPQRQNYVARLAMLVRNEPGANVYPGVRAAVREINSALPILHAQSLTDYTAIGLLPQRVASWVAGTLGALGLLLTGIGIYGIMAFSVGQRTREIGIRIALGASSQNILQLVLRAGAKLALLGMAVGIALALLATQLMSNLLIGISARDPITFLAVPLLMAGVTLLACYVPARRAARLDPMRALRYE